MRHRKKLKKLARPTDQRLAILKSLTRELLIHKRITTTLKRAKAVRKIVEKLITLAKKGGLTARRQALKILPDKSVIGNLFSDSGKFLKERKSGFTRVIRCGLRRGDAAFKAIIELVERPE